MNGWGCTKIKIRVVFLCSDSVELEGRSNHVDEGYAWVPKTTNFTEGEIPGVWKIKLRVGFSGLGSFLRDSHATRGRDSSTWVDFLPRNAYDYGLVYIYIFICIWLWNNEVMGRLLENYICPLVEFR